MDVIKFEDKVSPTMELARVLTVENDEQLGQANEHVKGIKALKKEIESTFDPMKKKAHETWKSIVAKEKEFMGPLDMAEGIIKGKMSGYLDILEKERQKEQERVAELARKERERLLNKVNKKLELLSQKSFSLQEQVTALETDLEDPEVTETEAEYIRVKIHTLKACIENNNSALLDQQVKIEDTYVPEPVMPDNTPKVAGMSQRKEKNVEVRNPMAVVKAVADNKVPISVLDFNMTILKKLSNAGMVIPGVLVSEKRIIGTRA